MTSTNTVATRDSVYYFRNFIFLVGNTIFQVPRNKLEVPGTVFESMSDWPSAGATPVGSSDENPIVLPVDEKYFRGFLGALYPFSSDKEMSSEDWIGALDLATMWMFKEIRAQAIAALGDWVTKTQDAKEGVLLAKKYKVLRWLKVSYSRLLQEDTLKIDELSSHPAFDWETIARLLYIKQEILTAKKDSASDDDYFCCKQYYANAEFCSKCYGSPLLGSVFQAEFQTICPKSKPAAKKSKTARRVDDPLPLPIFSPTI